MQRPYKGKIISPESCHFVNVFFAPGYFIHTFNMSSLYR